MIVTRDDLGIWYIVPLATAAVLVVPFLFCYMDFIKEICNGCGDCVGDCCDGIGCCLGGIATGIGKVFMYLCGALYNCCYRGFCCAGIFQNKRYVPDDAPKSAQCGLYCGDCAPCRAMCRCISGRRDDDIENQSRDEHLVPPGSHAHAANAYQAEQPINPAVAGTFPQPGRVGSTMPIRVRFEDDGPLFERKIDKNGEVEYRLVQD